MTNSTLVRMPVLTSLSSSLLIFSSEANSTFLFFLNTGCALSISLNLAAVFVHFPRRAAKISGKVFFSSVLRLCFSVVKDFTFWQKVLMGKSHKLNFCIQSVPNKFSVFFSTNSFNFFVVPLKVTFVINSPSNLIFVPVNVSAVIDVFCIVGLFNFLHVCKLIMVKSDPESSCNLTSLFKILTSTYLRILFSYFWFDTAWRTRFLLFCDLQCERLCPTFSQFRHF